MSIFTQQHSATFFPKISHSLAGFELGSSVPEADAMPLRHATPT
jgi:hypothetical protein